MEEQENFVEDQGLMQLSLQALHGSVGVRTMRLTRMHRKKQVYILINSKSTYNSVGVQTTSRFGVC